MAVAAPVPACAAWLLFAENGSVDDLVAALDDSEAGLLPADPEPQMEGWHLLWHAWSKWTEALKRSTVGSV